MATTKPKPRPEKKIDVSPRAEAGDQFFVEEAEKKAKSFSDIKPKIRPDSDKYKGRTYDIYSVGIDGKEINVIEFKDGKKISTPQIQQMFMKNSSASEAIPGKQTSQEISNFLEKNNPTYDEFIKHFTAKRLNKGGTPMLEEQMELFNEGGLKDEGGSVDPVSGNDVPIGSTKKEVRDDIPAMLSEGEFVFPADVTRFIGLEKLMQQRQEAKMGLKQMEAMGQMGNSEEATMPDDLPFGPADLVILGRPEEAEPKEMYGGGMVYANQGTFATGISGTQPSIYQGQTLPAAPAVPPSSVAPPTPTPAPAGGFIPTFIGQPTPNFTPSTPTTPVPTIPATPSGTADDDFFKTAGDVFEAREYINPETGERRTFNFMNDLPNVPIPDGFIPLKDYEEAEDAATDDLESTSVESTMVRDDNSATKRRLEDMVRDQGGNKLEDIKNKFDEGNKKEAEKDLVDLYLQNEKTKALMTGLGILNPAGLVGRGFTQLYGKQLEKLMTDQGIKIPEIEAGFLENLKGSLSGLFTGTDAAPEKYNPLYDPSDSPLTTVSNAENMLTSNEARAYDNAVKSGNARVAEHYEIVNNRLNKMKDYAEGKSVSGLSKFDEIQAKEMFGSKSSKKAKITSDDVKGLDTQTTSAFSDDTVFNIGPAKSRESFGQVDLDRFGRPDMEQIDLSGMGAGSARPSVQTDVTLPVAPKTTSAAQRKEEARLAAKRRRKKRSGSIARAKSISSDVTGAGADAISATRKAGPMRKGGLASKKKK